MRNWKAIVERLAPKAPRWWATKLRDKDIIDASDLLRAGLVPLKSRRVDDYIGDHVEYYVMRPNRRLRRARERLAVMLAKR